MDEKEEAKAYLNEITKKYPIGVYRHYKGGEYVLYSASINEADLTPLFHYYSILKKIRWTRECENFIENIPNIGSRFTFLRKATHSELRDANNG